MTDKIANRHWLILTGILFLAFVLRWAFFTGFFGSDEVTYTGQALLISEGIWQPSSYIGSVRLGVNLPVGFFFWLFGKSEFVANLWSLLCSLGEVGLVFLIARRFWGIKAAVFAALLLAFTPLHAHYATRLMADAPLSFFITLSFYSLFRGDADASWRWYAAAGLAAGFVWWIKSAVALVYVGVFVIYLIWENRVATKWFIMAAAFIAMIALNSLVFLVMQGDFWHLVKMHSVSDAAEHVQRTGVRTEATYYLRYLFLDVRHTWLLGPLSLLGLYYWMRSREPNNGLTKVAIWGLGLFSIFSFLVISFSTWTLISKQVNYMLIFIAPLALLGGYGLSRIPPTAGTLILTLIVLTGIVGTALEQLAIRSFVANSQPTLLFASTSDGRPVYGMTNAYRYSQYEKLFATIPSDVPRIHSINQLEIDSKTLGTEKPNDEGFVAYFVFDQQTSSWGKNERFSSIELVPQCWKHVDTISTRPTGRGAKLGEWLFRATTFIPYGKPVANKLENLLDPQPAWVYGIAPDCLL